MQANGYIYQPLQPPLNPKRMEPLQRDPYLWQKAKARAKFQAHLLSFLSVNAMLWVIWALTAAPRSHRSDIPWPLWVTAFWGLGLVARGVAAYGGFSYEQRAQREYDRLARAQADPLDKYR